MVIDFITPAMRARALEYESTMSDEASFDRLSPADQIALLNSLEALVGGERLEQWITRVFPHEPPPRHVVPILELIECARIKPIRICVSVGPGHAKTTSLLRSLVWWLHQSPADQCAYITYSSSQAHDKSKIAQGFAEESGLILQSDAAGHWRTTRGGGLIAAGAKGKLTGQRVPGLLIVDDPYKDEMEARSAAVNRAVKERFKAIAFTRLQGGSIVVLHTRWSDDDLIGWLTSELKWDSVNLQTVCDDVAVDPLGRSLGEPAWPDHYPYEICTKPCGHDGHLAEIRSTIGEHLWAAMYQGRPRPLGQAVFHEPARYRLLADPSDPASRPSEFSWTGKRGVIAIDPAATASSSSDWSVLLVCAMDKLGVDSTMWIVDCIRVQMEIPKLVKEALTLQRRYRLMIACEAVGGFKAVPQSLRAADPSLKVIDVEVGGRDKFTRAIPLSAAWNEGRVLVPMDAPWADTLVAEFRRFTGSGDKHDDQVDCGSHAWNVLYRAKPRIVQDDYEDAIV